MHSVARDRRALTRQRYHFISDPAGGLAPALTVALGGKGEEIETRIKSETGEEEGEPSEVARVFPRSRETPSVFYAKVIEDYKSRCRRARCIFYKFPPRDD